MDPRMNERTKDVNLASVDSNELFTSGLGSHRSEQIESNTLEIVNAGDHCERRMSRQIAPLELMLG